MGDGRALYGDYTIPHLNNAATSTSQHSDLFMGDIQKSIDLQQQILINSELKQLSMDLLTEKNGTFIAFISKCLNDKIMDKMWAKLDNENNGYIESSEDIADAIAFMV